MSELEKLLLGTLDRVEESPAKQRSSSLAIVPAYNRKSSAEISAADRNAVEPMNPAYHLAGGLVDRMKGYLVKNPSDSKYQVARELVSVIKSGKGRLSDTILAEIGALVAYRGISYGLEWLKKYFSDKKK
jgi:hypothetical protein